jgi:hypothetical protein
MQGAEEIGGEGTERDCAGGEGENATADLIGETGAEDA